MSARPLLARVALRLGSPAAFDRALEMIVDGKVSEPDRTGLIDALGQMGKPDCIPVLEDLLSKAKSNALRLAALNALQAFPDPQITTLVLSLYPQLSGELHSRAQTLLFSRPASTLAFLQAVDAGNILPNDVPLDQLRRAVQYDQSDIKKLVAKHWGQVAAPPPGARVARINSVLHLLGQGRGQPIIGKELFQKHCATCHTLFGEGNKIGPDLTSVDRKNRSFLVTSIVDPSAIIRPEFVAHTVATTDGRMLTGLIVERSPSAITLLDAKNERTVLAQSKIDSLEPSSVSLMPDNILDPLDDQQIRDLFSYLQDESQAHGSQLVGLRTLKVCLVSGSLEYDSDASLAGFQEFLEKNYDVKCSRAFRKTDADLPGLDNLDTCDVMLLFTRRLTISGEQLDKIKKYCQSGKPIVGVRTASHAFQNWLALDKEVFGGNYQGHYGVGPAVEVHIEDKAKSHPILSGIKSFSSAGSLYKNSGLTNDVEVLLTGAIPGHTEPVAWTRLNHGGLAFYTSLGHQKDFADENFKQLLVNALYWTTKCEVTKKVVGAVESNGSHQSSKPSANFRKPPTDSDLRYWLENMVWHHRFSVAEVSAATGLTADEVHAALKKFHIDPVSKPKRPADAALLILPYPGGRHPRIGFLEGAIQPQRETKVSIFTPWDDHSYVVIDVPEAIWSNLGLTYLAHTHVPTIWTKQSLELEPLEWNRHKDGSLDIERKLPNGIIFGAKIASTRETVHMELSLTNGTKERLSDLGVQNCVMLKGAAGFEPQTNDNKVFSKPYSACRSADRKRWIITAWEPCDRAWGNANCPCLHSDPKFPDCPPGETRRLTGRLWFYEGTDIQSEFRRLDQTGWRKGGDE